MGGGRGGGMGGGGMGGGMGMMSVPPQVRPRHPLLSNANINRTTAGKKKRVTVR